MDEKPASLDSVRLDENAARRLIARATELDAGLASQSSIADLREAARGAGISDEAFRRALAEIRAEHVPTHTPPIRVQPWRKYFVAVVIGLLLALWVMMRVIPAAVQERNVVPTPPAGEMPVIPPPR